MNGCLLMATTYTGPQRFERAKLKLLDCSLRPAKLLCDISNTFLFHETLDNDGALIFRKAVDQLKESGPAFDVRPAGWIQVVVSKRIRVLSRQPPPPISDQIRRNPV